VPASVRALRSMRSSANNGKKDTAVTESTGAFVHAAELETVGGYDARSIGVQAVEKKSTISEVSREFGVTLRALRFYENKGMIAPERRGSARFYSAADRERLGAILEGKKLGFSLAEIGRMVGEPAGGSADLGLTEAKCLEQIASLEDQKRSIETALIELRRILAGLAPKRRIAC
jgi:DNA-binding transcriptional MerR regulator